MPKYTKLPPITGKKLRALLEKGGWTAHRRTRHGIALIKEIDGRTKITIVQDTRANIPDGTLADIVGPKQTGIGKKGLLDLANKYGI